MARLRYGRYLHDENECTVAIAKRANVTGNDVVLSVTQTWTIQGTLQADTPAAVVAKVVALERAYAVWGLDFQLYDPGTGLVYHGLPSAGSLTGVKILQPPSFPKGDGAELSTYRTYTIVAECEYPATMGGADGGAALAGDGPLKEFTESLAFTGGGRRRAVFDVVNGPAQVQTLFEQTAYRAVQSGSAVGWLNYPPVPLPLWREALLDAPDVQYGSPVYRNGVYTDWPVSWVYRFGSPTPLLGTPNAWPAGGG